MENAKVALRNGSYNSVIYNLDQCGYSHVRVESIRRLMNSAKSVEIFLTYNIKSFLAFTSQRDQKKFHTITAHLNLPKAYQDLPKYVISKKEFLGSMQQLAFDTFKQCAPFFSPFAIHNPDGWDYWLIHFSKRAHARRVFNDVLHQNSNTQAHYGKAGINMLSYEPEDPNASLYLFDEEARETSRYELQDDIGRFVSEHNYEMQVDNFYVGIYNDTPAHSDDIHTAIHENTSLEVVTEKGRKRRKSHTIDRKDVIRVKRQFTLDFGKKR